MLLGEKNCAFRFVQIEPAERKELCFPFIHRTCGAKRAMLFAPIITESQQARKTGKY
jgi:hypothetical protein